MGKIKIPVHFYLLLPENAVYYPSGFQKELLSAVSASKKIQGEQICSIIWKILPEAVL